MEVSEMEERKIGQIKEELKAATAEIRGRTKKNLETAGIRTKIWSVHLYLWD